MTYMTEMWIYILVWNKVKVSEAKQGNIWIHFEETGLSKAKCKLIYFQAQEDPH